jgi:Zn-dependent metalloprotease
MKKKLLNLLGIFVLASSAQAQLSQNQIQQNLRNELENLKFIGSSQVNIRVNSQYQTKHNGVTHVYVNQQLNGLEILNAQADLHFTKEGKLIVMHHNFIPNAVNRVTNKFKCKRSLIKRFGI